MTLEIISDEQQAEQLWKQFVDSPSWYNQWDVRHLFYTTKEYAQLAFYIALENNTPVALLPLQISRDTQTLEFFGGRFFEDNQAWGNNDTAKQFLYQSLSGKINLDSIVPLDHHFDPRMNLGDEKFILPIQAYTDISQYLQLFSSKRRNSLKRAFKKLVLEELTITKGTITDLEMLFAFNKKRFGTESVFQDEKHTNCFRQMVTLPYDWHIYTFKIKGLVEAVSLSVNCDGTYIYHNAGTNVADYPNLGNMVIYHNIKMAIENGSHFFDAGSEDLGWKKRWHLEPLQLYTLTNQ